MQRRRCWEELSFSFVAGFIVSTALILYHVNDVASITIMYADMIAPIITIIVAAAALWINKSHLDDNRKSRIWELNKKETIDLLDLLNNEIINIEIGLHNDTERIIQEQPYNDYSPDLRNFVECDYAKIKELVNKFKLARSPFISKSLRDAIEEYHTEHEKTSDDIDNGACDDVFTMYDRSSKATNKLIQELLKFSEDLSGVRSVFRE